MKSTERARIRIVSDLHFEFHADAGATLAVEVTSGDYDVLVIAGDLTSSESLSQSLALLASINARPVVYVLGNHEFYGSSRTRVMAAARASAHQHSNLHVLDSEVVTIDGVRFVGAPLWFEKTPGAPTWAMNDFGQIENFSSWVYAENARARDFLESEVRDGDVVVTHHLPAEQSIHAKYKGSRLNAFFLCDMEPLIRRCRPALWVHGHTHESCDYRIGKTRVVCNPFGYAREEENREFDSEFTVSV